MKTHQKAEQHFPQIPAGLETAMRAVLALALLIGFLYSLNEGFTLLFTFLGVPNP
jgi:hypothetical protein